MTPEQEAAVSAAPSSVSAAPIDGKAALRKVVVTTADGRVFDLGKPWHPIVGARLFNARVRIYKWRRRHELREAANG